MNGERGIRAGAGTGAGAEGDGRKEGRWDRDPLVAQCSRRHQVAAAAAAAVAGVR